MITLKRYKKNLKVMSASQTTTKHINYVARELGLTVIEKHLRVKHE